MLRVSTIIPCFNAAEWVGAAITSVLGQTRAPDEVIVVDDGSTDASVSEIKRFGAKVQLITQANRGVAAARNTGLGRATGSLLSFLDADDLWPEDSLALRLETLHQTAADVVFGRVRQGRGHEAEPLQVADAGTPGRLAGAMLIRRSALDRVGLFNEQLRSAETLDLVARADEAGCSSAMADGLVLIRRLHGANMMLAAQAHDQIRLRMLRDTLARRRTQAAQ